MQRNPDDAEPRPGRVLGALDADRTSRRRLGRHPDAFLETLGLQVNIQTEDRQKINEQERSRRDQNMLGKLAHEGKLAHLL